MIAVLRLLDRPLTGEEVLAAVAQASGLGFTNQAQYYLTDLTVKAYLGYLLDGGKITPSYEGGRQLFGRVSPSPGAQ